MQSGGAGQRGNPVNGPISQLRWIGSQKDYWRLHTDFGPKGLVADGGWTPKPVICLPLAV